MSHQCSYRTLYGRDVPCRRKVATVYVLKRELARRRYSGQPVFRCESHPWMYNPGYWTPITYEEYVVQEIHEL